VPSQTELLYHLGLADEVVGITKFCIHPNEWFRNKTRVGGTKTVNIEKVRALKPDLIIANKEENVKEQVEQLQQVAPVYVSDINTLEDALQMITTIGELTHTSSKAGNLTAQIENSFADLSSSVAQQSTPINTAYLIWKDPYMAAGGDTFIHDMMKRSGLNNVFANIPRYPEVSIAQLLSANCQLLLLSSEPYPFKEKHIAELQQQLPQTKILLADGEMFSWYGSRMLQAPAYFGKLIAQVRG
jgi:ABC-type Fe3+-hydroxamate transport system substrate-binding protein